MSRRFPLQAIAAAVCNGAVARELAGVSTVVLNLSLGRSRPEPEVSAPVSVLPGASRFATPIVLVHGYGGNRSAWQHLERRLGEAGFANRHSVDYNAFSADIPAIAGTLVDVCRDAMDHSGVRALHLVGHSLGGVVVRYAVQCLGLPAGAVTAVTVAAPHRGTPVALLGTGPAAAAMRPGSRLLAQLDGPPPAGVHWVAYRAGLDFVVRPRSACLADPAWRARNILVPDEGHLSILGSPAFLSSVIAELMAQEARWAADQAVAAAAS